MIYRSARLDAEAPYRLPPQPKIDNRQSVCRGRYDAGDVDRRIIEFAGNSVDFRHFSQRHGTMRIPWINIKFPWIGIRHEPSWRLDDNLEHVSYFSDEATLEIGGRKYGRTRSRALIAFLGPGSIVKFDFDVLRIGEATMFQTHTPVEPLKQRITFRWFAPRRMPRIFVSCVIGNWISQWRQDLKIWNGKVYRQCPLLAAGDGPVWKMRRCYRQFYPDGLAENLSGKNTHAG